RQGRCALPFSFPARARILHRLSSVSLQGEARAASPMKDAIPPALTGSTVAERDGQFLLIEERTRHGLRLNQPAGHVEAGESIVSAAARETLEEAASRAGPTSLVGRH